jgi:hypothetical protein
MVTSIARACTSVNGSSVELAHGQQRNGRFHEQRERHATNEPHRAASVQ